MSDSDEQPGSYDDEHESMDDSGHEASAYEDEPEYGTAKADYERVQFGEVGTTMVQPGSQATLLDRIKTAATAVMLSDYPGFKNTGAITQWMDRIPLHRLHNMNIGHLVHAMVLLVGNAQPTRNDMADFVANASGHDGIKAIDLIRYIRLLQSHYPPA